MPTASDIEPHIKLEFGSRLEPLGFRQVSKRKWVRSQKLPIRELFEINALKGASYSPAWGFSFGFVPSYQAQTFRRQSTDKNAVMNLIIDPIDIPGVVPPQAFDLITDDDIKDAAERIRICAEHFVPLALSDFNRVHSVHDFCHFFLERSNLRYRRFGFDNYTNVMLAFGFVLILIGKRDEGLEKIREFCKIMEVQFGKDAKFDDRVLSESIRYVESQKTVA
jgi:hypothetical protein